MRKLIFVFVVVHCIFLIPSTRDCLSQWVQVNNGMGNATVYSLAYSGNNIFAGTGYGVFLSTNNGSSWVQTSLNNQTVRPLAVNGNNIFAGTNVNGVYLSTNNGTSWTQTSLNNQTVRSLAVNGNNIFAGTDVNGVYLSTNNGINWTQTPLNNRTVLSLAVSGNNVFAGTSIYGLYLSANNGISWTQISLNSNSVLSLAVNGNNLFAGTVFYPPHPCAFSLLKSTDNGTTWTNSLFCVIVNSLAVNVNNVFAGTGGVYVSNNNGANWTQRNEGLGNLNVRALCILDNYIFAGTDSSVYRRLLSEFVGVQPISNEIPKQFSLSQNYPNPFNPSTKIKFEIPPGSSVAQTFVRPVGLSVYDILGREISILVNEELSPGTYEVDWDASNYPSGIYYYTLSVGQFTETRKAVLIK